MKLLVVKLGSCLLFIPRLIDAQYWGQLQRYVRSSDPQIKWISDRSAELSWAELGILSDQLSRSAQLSGFNVPYLTRIIGYRNGVLHSETRNEAPISAWKLTPSFQETPTNNRCLQFCCWLYARIFIFPRSWLRKPQQTPFWQTDPKLILGHLSVCGKRMRVSRYAIYGITILHRQKLVLGQGYPSRPHDPNLRRFDTVAAHANGQTSRR